MKKLVAIMSVISWSGFWAFGYIAVTAHVSDTRQMTVAAILAFMGLVTGMAAYLWLAREVK